MTRAAKPKVVIFVVAYHAESTLESVLSRIPASVFEDYDCSILVVDDASSDRTEAVGREYQRSHPEVPLTVLRNEYNQVYGGNQKVGYTHALAQGADAIALLHGDAQYAPEELPKLLAPLCRGEADAVLGSRMLDGAGALRGGMPLYKYVGNRVLSFAQNKLLGTALSEFHCGYRAYSGQCLRRIKFKLNSNDFHFDTEVVIQILNAGGRILEVPIPTYYGGGIAKANGVKYAKNVLKVTLQNVAHRSGLLYQRRFDPADDKNTHYDLKLGYASSHTYALERVANGTRVLDIGAGPGGMARELVKKHCVVSVMDQHAPMNPSPDIDVITQDLDLGISFDAGRYDVLLLLDIIEHLKDPELFFERLRRNFDHAPKTLILTTPNVAFVAQRIMLLLGQFNYGRTGILDMTHTRLFTFRSLERLLRDGGFRLKKVRGVPAPFPKALGDGVVARWALALNELAIRVSPALFSYQIYVEAESTPDPEFLVQDARSRGGLTLLNIGVRPREPARA